MDFYAERLVDLYARWKPVPINTSASNLIASEVQALVRRSIRHLAILKSFPLWAMNTLIEASGRTCCIFGFPSFAAMQSQVPSYRLPIGSLSARRPEPVPPGAHRMLIPSTPPVTQIAAFQLR